jgi:hypothetical protein
MWIKCTQPHDVETVWRPVGVTSVYRRSDRLCKAKKGGSSRFDLADELLLNLLSPVV